MIDRDGILRLRWVSRGGVQITARVFVAHRDMVLEAWRMQEAILTHDGDVFRPALVADSKTLLLRKAGA